MCQEYLGDQFVVNGGLKAFRLESATRCFKGAKAKAPPPPPPPPAPTQAGENLLKSEVERRRKKAMGYQDTILTSPSSLGQSNNPIASLLQSGGAGGGYI